MDTESSPRDSVSYRSRRSYRMPWPGSRSEPPGGSFISSPKIAHRVNADFAILGNVANPGRINKQIPSWLLGCNREQVGLKGSK